MSDKRLSYFYFDGTVNRKQTFDVSKPSKTAAHEIDEREKFLKKLKDDRTQRELDRIRDEKCRLIQALWRGYRQRKISKNVIRSEFDKFRQAYKQNDGFYGLKWQIRRLYYFFTSNLDGDRLIWLCQLCLKYSFVFHEDILKNQRLRKKLLSCCVKYLWHIGDSNLSFALPLRCLETYFKMNDVSLSIITQLIYDGYFETFLKLLNSKVPSDLSEETVKPPTPFAETAFDCLLYPLEIAAHQNDANFKRFVLQRFLSVFFIKNSLSPVVRYFVLPSICKCQRLTFDDFANAFDGEFGQRPKSVELTYGVLYLMANCPMKLKETSSVILFTILPSLLTEFGVKDLSSNNADSDDEGEQEHMDFTHTTTDAPLIQASLSLLNSKRICEILLSMTDDSSMLDMSSSCLNSYIYVCHILLALKGRATFEQNRILFLLSFKPKFLAKLWNTVVSCTVSTIMGPRPLIEILQRGNPLTDEDRLRFLPMLSVFCALFSTSLLTMNDEEFYRDANLKLPGSLVPFSLPEMAAISSILRDVTMGLIELALPDARPNVSESYREALIGMGADFTPQNTTEWNRLFECVVRLLVLLHDRDERLQFCPIGHWCVRNRITLQNRQMFRRNRQDRGQRLFGVARYLTRSEFEDKKDVILSASELRTLTVLRKIPFVVPFEERVMLLYQLTLLDQQENGRTGVFDPGLSLHVRRNFIYEDSYDKLSYEQPHQLKHPLRVTMSNWAGAEEAGIDGGGIFREFLSELLKSGFDPSRGLFATTHDQLLYPNPLARKIFPETYRRHYHFLGRMLGKMIYENQLTELPFARFFLSKLLSRHSGDIDVHHLSSLDPVLHKNLISLKNMETGIAQLDLDFTVMIDEFGEISTLELKPDGSKIRVTNDNKLEYVQLMADFYLNKQIKEQTASFREGLSELIDLDWLQMFDYRELQIIISGVDRIFDVADLRNNTKYNEFADEYIDMFWRVVSSFTDEQKRKLLKFVTGCSRAPLLGFKDLHPPFSIQVVPAAEKRLPSAATCMNLLKLPRFSDERTLRDKLSYAIESGAGFELS